MPEQRGLFDDLVSPDPADIRARHPGMLILMRTSSESYEWMEEDRALVARLGVPVYLSHLELEEVLRKVLRAGHRVAVCDPSDRTTEKT